MPTWAPSTGSTCRSDIDSGQALAQVHAAQLRPRRWDAHLAASRFLEAIPADIGDEPEGSIHDDAVGRLAERRRAGLEHLLAREVVREADHPRRRDAVLHGDERAPVAH